MPPRKSAWFCGCFGGRTPEIKYGDATENGMMMMIHPVQVDMPIPEDEGELNAMFTELVDELDLDRPHREAMFSLPPEKKWQIYCSKKREQDDPNSTSWPDYYIERVNTMSSVFFAYDEEDVAARQKLVDGLKTALRTQPMRFVTRFIELNGLQCLIDFLRGMDYETQQSTIHTSILGCLKALMNNSQGRAHVLAHPTAVNIIAQSLSTENIKTKITVLEILGAMCLVPGGHKRVLEAMFHYQKYACERCRFQSVVYDLDRSTGIYRDEVNLKTAIMSFINAALKYGPGQDRMEFRMHLRYEFLMLGIQPVIDKLREHQNATLDRHLDFFEMVRAEDEKEFAKKFEVSHVDTKSATSMFELLRKKLAFTTAYPHLLSILQHSLQLPFTTPNGNSNIGHYWQLIDRVVQQIAIQQKDGKDPDVAPLEGLDVNKIVKQLARENEMKEFQNKLRELSKENDELAAKLVKKERECEIRTQEKEDLMETVNKMKSRLERESTGHAEAKVQIGDLITRLNEFKNQIEVERREREKLEQFVKTGSLPDDAKVNFTTAASSLSSMSAAPASAPPPPPPPPGAAPPPPPPPPGPPPAPGCPAPPGIAGGPPPPGGAVKKKNIPKPQNPLKSFNWAKIPDSKLTNTVWGDIDDTKLYKTLNLEEFENMFSAYQRKEEDQGLQGQMSVKGRSKELSVIDGRRAQNCYILLSRLKMTDDELARAILTMDDQEELPKDMCEQLLKFVPTPEEAQMLSEQEQDLDQMARADRFLYDMSKIVHYEQRLKALCYKKKFSERISDLRPRVEAVLNASIQVLKSKKLRKLLEIVLAFGNFMNRGQRGNASGFKLQSLNRIVDTKSSANKQVTLLHYLVTTVECKFPEVLKLEQEIPDTRFASKVGLQDLETEIRQLKLGLKEIEKELDFHKNRMAEDRRDKFVSVINDFVTIASYKFSEIEDLVTEMNEKFHKVLKLYGEEPGKMQPDEFFGVFDVFLTSFCEAKIENERIRKQKEEEEKRAKLEAQRKAELEKKAKNSLKNGTVNGSKQEDSGEFDDLISALRTGDAFGDDIAKMKGRQRRRVSGAKNGDLHTRERMGTKNGR